MIDTVVRDESGVLVRGVLWVLERVLNDWQNWFWDYWDRRQMVFVIYCEVIPRNRICWMLVMNECKWMSMNVNSVNNNLLQNNGVFVSQALKNLTVSIFILIATLWRSFAISYTQTVIIFQTLGKGKTSTKAGISWSESLPTFKSTTWAPINV